MNRNRYRLVFSRRLGFRIPVAEHLSSCPKGATGVRVAVAGALALLGGSALAGANLPTPASVFVRAGSPGTANLPTVNGTTMTIQQTSQAPVVMQWQNFDIGQGHTVRFVQPTAQSRAINVVLPGGTRSDIYGNLQANGQVYLFNQAGILFGPGARVDVGGLVASTLKLNDKLIEQSLSALSGYDAVARTYTYGEAALARDGAAGDIRVEQGARIVAAKNGRVLIAAPNVTNAGEISTPEGQTLLAAGEKLYIADSIDSRLRGVLVEVSGGGSVTNEAAGALLAERGNITLAGLNVSQQGAARATTSATLNGSIYLQARSSVEGANGGLTAQYDSGAVVLGAASTTTIDPESTAADTLRDDAAFNRSEVDLVGKTIDLQGQARISATAGSVTLTAVADRGAGGVVDPEDAKTAAIRVGDQASIDVSGLRDVKVAGNRDVVDVELRGDELKDSPLQRDTAEGRPLYGKKVSIDVVKGFEVDDGAAPLADISGYRKGIERSVAELSTVGGTIALQSEGRVTLAQDASLDVSGGSVTYTSDGAQLTPKTYLKTQAGPWVAVENARADVRYTGETRTVLQQTADRVIGNDAGRVVVSGQSVTLDGQLRASTVRGIDQRTSTATSRRWFDWSYAGEASAASAFVERIESQVLERERVRTRIEQFVGNPLTRANLVQTGRLGWTGSAAPQGGTLELRANLDDAAASAAVGDIVLTGAVPAAGVRAADTLYLSSSLLHGGGFNQLLLAGRGAFTLAAGTVIDGMVGSRLSVTAREVRVEGAQGGVAGAQVHLPGGEILLSTVNPVAEQSQRPEDNGISVGSGARLSTAGVWTNDRLSPPAALSPAAVAVDGGTIRLDSNADLTVNGALDASAGAWRVANGSVKTGDGGRIALATGSFGDGATPSRALVLGPQSSLTAYASASFDGADSGHGGTLAVDASALLLAPASLPAGGTSAGTLRLDDTFFGQGGFSDFLLTGKTRVDIAAGASIAPVPWVQAISPQQQLAASARTLSAASLRRDSAFVGGPGSMTIASDASAVGTIVMAQGSRIAMSPGGRITLDAAARMAVDGVLQARGGEVSLSTAPVVPDLTNRDRLNPADNIHLGQQVRIDVSGATVATPGAPWNEGQVLDGGNIAIDAGRGYVVMQSGAALVADGAVGMLDIVSPFGGVARNQVVASAGGTIAVSAREGMLLDGMLSAHAGRPGVAGGELSLALSSQGQWFGVVGETFGGNLNPARTLVVATGGSAGADAIAAGSVVPSASHLGRARIDSAKLTAGGFQDVRLASTDTIAFEGDTTLALPGRLRLEAPNLTGDAAANVTLSAASIALTQSDNSALRKRPNAPTGATGSGALVLQANEIDVRGRVAVSGFASTRLAALNEMRLSGQDAGGELVGRLVTNGDLTLAAGVIYPTSGADFSVELRNNPLGTLSIAAIGADRTPWSALGRLSLIAPNIVQGGRLRAPFGELSLSSGLLTDSGTTLGDRTSTPVVGGRVELVDGSVTSVSADGMTLPYGQTQVAGREWVFDTGTSLKPLETAPDKRIALSGDRIDIGQGALVDVSGGGDLQAWEFIAGRGGSTDLLAGSAGTYALVPAIGSGAAPYAADTWSDSPVQVGQIVRILSGANGLPAGDYTLLPARYGLVDGAYTIRIRDDMADLSPTGGFVGTDGIAVVAARFGEKLAGGAVFDSRTVGLEVLSGRDVRLRSEYLESAASTFFPAAGGSVADAGRLALRAGSQLDVTGIVRANKGAGGRGSQIDLTADRLAVLADGRPAQAGEVVLSPELLARLNAESLLLGATRERVLGDGATPTWLIASDAPSGGANSVRVDTRDGDALKAPEIILAARDTLSVESGSRIEATAGATQAPQTLVVAGSGTAADGALLHVSSGGGVTVQRDTPSGSSGSLVIGRNATLAGRSITSDATGSVRLDGVDAGNRQFDLTETGGTVTFSASRLGFGQVSAGTTGLVLDASALAELGDAAVLALRSYSTVDLYGATTIGASTLDALVIDAAGIVTRDAAGAQQNIVAKSVTLTHTGTAVAASVNADAGSQLNISAERIVLGETPAAGAFRSTGAAQTTWSASAEVIGQGEGRHVVDGDLAVTTGRMTVATGADTTLDVGQTLTVTSSGSAPGTAAGVGGRLALNAEQIAVSSRVEARAGEVMLTARSGDVVIDSADPLRPGLVSAAGVEVALGPQTAAFSAGQVRLQADAGDVVVGAGGLVDVSAPGGADAGEVSLIATQGKLVLDGALKATTSPAADLTPSGGALAVDVAQLGDAAGSLAALARASADFTRAVNVRVRSGDMVLGATDRIASEDIGLFADDGRIDLHGVLDASGDKGGAIRVYANGGNRAGSGVLNVDGARLLAMGQGAGGAGTAGDGGRIELGVSASDGSAASPRLILQRGRVDVSSVNGAGGDVVLSAPRGADGTSMAMDAIDTRVMEIVGAGAVDVVGYARESARRIVTSGNNSGSTLNLGGLFELVNDAISGAGVPTTARVVGREAVVVFGRALLGATAGDDFEALARADGGSWLGALLGDLVGDAAGNVDLQVAAGRAIDQAFRGVAGGAHRTERSVAAVLAAGLEQLGTPAAVAAAVRSDLESTLIAGSSDAAALASARAVLAQHGLGAGSAADSFLSGATTDLVDATRVVSQAASAAGLAATPESAVKLAVSAFGTQRSYGANRALTSAQATALANQVWSLGNPDAGRYRVFASTQRFIGHADAMIASLGLAGVANVGARAEIQVRSSGDLRVDDVLDFGNVAVSSSPFGNIGTGILPVWQSGNHAGMLTLVAAGNVNINKSVLDGKTRRYVSSASTGAFRPDSQSEFALAGTPSWALRVVAGADGTAADPMGTMPADAFGRGRVTVARDAVMRTGTAQIDLAAQGDVVLGGSTAAVFTVGTIDAGATDFRDDARLSRARDNFGRDGGDIRIRAGGSLTAVGRAVQDVSAWLKRQGSVDGDGRIYADGPTASNPTWFVQPENFGQGVATLGGGDLIVSVGQDVRNVVLATATAGRIEGGIGDPASAANLRVTGGGDLTVVAGRDVTGSTLYAGAGDARLAAGRNVGSTSASDAVRVALGDTRFRVSARGDVILKDVFNPTLEGSATGTYFSTYGAASALRVDALAGRIALGSFAFGPAQLWLSAPAGDIEIAGGTLLPSEHTVVSLLAQEDVVFSGTLTLSGLDPDSIARPARPVSNNASFLVGAPAARPVALTSTRAVTVVSAQGDVIGPDHRTGGATPALVSSLPVAVYSGGDVKDFGFVATHGRLDQVSTVTALGDVVFAPKLNPSTGALENTSTVGMIVHGPGRLAVTAGGDVDLGNSLGIVSRGNVDNAYLPELSAAIDVLAGTRGADYAALLAATRPGDAAGTDVFDRTMLGILGGGSLEALLGDPDNATLNTRRETSRAELQVWFGRYDDALLSHMRAKTGNAGLDRAAAEAAFAALPGAEREAFFQQQRPVLNEILFASLRYAGRMGDALAAGAGGYAAGFQVLASAFPAGGEGNIEGFLSQFKTVQDVESADSLASAGLPPDHQEHASAIALIAPYGAVNVGVPGGVAGDPTRTGVVAIGKGNVDIVARDSVEVGPSRIFTLGGGAIQAWSSLADIDGGSSPKTAAATPQPTLRPKGDSFELDVSASVSGGGIATLKKLPTVRNAPVRLYAPNGVVDAGDAGIRVSGDLEIGAQQIIGADNISVGGSLSSSASAPPPAAPAVSPASSNPTDAVEAANAALENDPPAAGPSGDSSLLTVEVLAMGEGCDEAARKRGECQE
ncbi:two-partner secretion domain-containing protein [Denitromonas iodatirespirans]|uniref:Filamentous hemagglutinin family protein n=1 Tax=Denitromonas iodatirespirans TaxID=2795389 RepID=A0A944DC40_DENI1|nr:filamentous haemagglutinin family protein [Denitromonas iodatirespirans]MBT0962712.1 filamentous hemagglutinin family protein [Denitromonas iodatirespirans]